MLALLVVPDKGSKLFKKHMISFINFRFELQFLYFVWFSWTFWLELIRYETLLITFSPLFYVNWLQFWLNFVQLICLCKCHTKRNILRLTHATCYRRPFCLESSQFLRDLLEGALEESWAFVDFRKFLIRKSDRVRKVKRKKQFE